MLKKRWLAVVLSAAMTSGMLGSLGVKAAEIDFDEEPYEATLMYWVANDARDVEAVEEEFNKLTMEQLNMKVDLMPVTLGTYGQQIQMILSSDDKLDIFPFWPGSMGTYIDADYIVDMSEYLEDYGQDLIDIIGEDDRVHILEVGPRNVHGNADGSAGGERI